MELIPVILSSAVLTTLVSKIGEIILNRLNRKDEKEDQRDKASAEIMQIIKDMQTRLECLHRKVERSELKAAERDAVQCRVRILRFSDELLEGKRHTKGNFDQVLADCQDYEEYCAKHPDFRNGITEPSIDHIRHVYKVCLDERSFL